MHLVPRPLDDVRAGGPLEDDAFNQAETPALEAPELEAQADALRTRLA